MLDTFAFECFFQEWLFIINVLYAAAAAAVVIVVDIRRFYVNLFLSCNYFLAFSYLMEYVFVSLYRSLSLTQSMCECLRVCVYMCLGFVQVLRSIQLELIGILFVFTFYALTSC